MSETTGIEQELMSHARSRVHMLQSQYARRGEQPTQWAAATMAALRRADPARPGDDPALWEVVFDKLPPALANTGSDKPSRAESAAHAALCLYAAHQQSRDDPMHKPEVRFGQAVRALARARAPQGEQLSPGVVRRFHVAGTATTPTRRLSELRALLTMMRAAKTHIPLDYGLLARDLYRLDDTRRAPGVRLAWGRDLRRYIPDEQPSTDTSDTPDNLTA